MKNTPWQGLFGAAGFFALALAHAVAAGGGEPRAAGARPAALGRLPRSVMASPPPRAVGRKPRGWLSPQAATGHGLLYVANIYEVVIYLKNGRNPQPIGTITSGVDSAYGLYVDERRYL